MKMSKKLLAVASLAFASALSAGIAVNASAASEQRWDGFAITARAIRTENPAGLRFRTEAAELTPELMAQFATAKCYTTVSFTTQGGLSYTTDVPVGVWRTEANDANYVPGWNTVLLDIPNTDYATDITAKSYIVVNETTTYATEAVTVSIAQTASEVMNAKGAIDETLNAYVTNVQSLTVDATATAFVGESTQLTATIAPANYKVVWTTSDETVATVDKDGKVTGVQAGQATITAKMGDKEASCVVTVYNKHVITTAEDFKNTYFSYTDVPASEYYMLANDIDFSGIVLNETPDYKTPLDFRGVIDGNGYAIINLTMAPWSTTAADPGYPAFMVRCWGTVKNLAAIMTLKVDSGTNARHGAFIAMSQKGTHVSNCYFNMTTDIEADINWPIGTATGGYADNGGAVLIENTVGVLNAPQTGLSTGLVGRVNGSTTLTLKNCYAVEVGAATPEYYPAAWTAPTTVVNTTAYSTLGAMYADAKTGITAENGWNNFWKFDAVSETLKFGDLVVYNGKLPQLNVEVATLYAAKGANENNMPTELDLDMLYTNATATFESSNDAVASVDANGVVSAVGGGSAVITATTSEGTYTCNVTVYNYHEIARAEDFKDTFFTNAKDTVIPATEYFMLANDIDFTGITLNKTDGYVAPLEFYGVLDGDGHAITNLTMAPWEPTGFASFVVRHFGTVKNLAAVMTLDVAAAVEARNGAFLGITRAGAYVSNCYFNLTTAIGADMNWPTAAISGGSASNGSSVNIENCIGVVKAPTDALAAGIYGRVNGSTVINIKNCYAVEVGAVSPEVYGTKWTAPTMQNVSAYSTLLAMYADAKTGITADKGWADFWSVENGMLKFGTLTICSENDPQLNRTSADLFLVSGANTNNVSNQVDLDVLYTEAPATFVSSNDAVATVNANGVVTAVAPGSATITATTSEGTYTCAVTVYNYHEIATAEDFKNTYFSYTDVPATEYYMLANNVDFTGIVLNETEGYITPLDFRGVIDGNGYAITNLTMAPWSTTAADPGYASFMVRCWGTVKNLAAIMTAKVETAPFARHAAFAGITHNGTHIMNCYFHLTTAVGADMNWPTAAISGGSAMGGGSILIENCIGVVDAPADSLTSGIYGRPNGTMVVNVKNCYAVELNDETPEIFGLLDGNSHYTSTNNTAHSTLASVFESAKADMIAANGWNSFWSVDNGTLKFGDLVVYQAE